MRGRAHTPHIRPGHSWVNPCFILSQAVPPPVPPNLQTQVGRAHTLPLPLSTLPEVRSSPPAELTLSLGFFRLEK